MADRGDQSEGEDPDRGSRGAAEGISSIRVVAVEGGGRPCKGPGFAWIRRGQFKLAQSKRGIAITTEVARRWYARSFNLTK